MPRNLAEDVAVRQLRQAEKIRRRLDKHLNAMSKADEQWVPDVDFVKASAENSRTITQLLNSLRLQRKAHKDAMGGLTQEQLDAVFVHNLKRIASALTDEQWHALLSIKFGDEVARVMVPAQGDS